MKYLPSVASISFLLVLSCGANAADWQIIHNPNDGGGQGYLQLDRASVRREGNTVHIWTRAVYKQYFSVPGAPAIKARVIAAKTEFNCVQRTELLRRVAYLSDDESQIILREEGPLKEADVIPGTPREALLNLACQIAISN